MSIFLCILSIFAFIKTISYSIFELNKNNNKSGFILVIAVAIIGLAFSNIAIWFIY